VLRKFRSHRPTHATVVAYLALFVALGGTAYAAATIGSAQVIDNSLQSVDLKDNAGVKSSDVVNDTTIGGGLVGADVRPNSLSSADVKDLTGADLAAGSIGVREVADISDWIQQSTSVPASGGVGSVTARCPSGAKVLGGGADFFFPSGEISRSRPVKTEEGEGWHAAGQNNGNADQFLLAWAICLRSSR
jgi:hypothetical protein